MQRGQRYRVVFLIPSMHRKPRVMVGTYLGDTENQQAAQFDLRPEAGTTTVPHRDIQSTQSVGASTPVELPHVESK